MRDDIWIKRLLGSLLLVCSSTVLFAAPRERSAAFAEVKDAPNLPRVLLLGDSISIGYTVPVRQALKGIANLHRPAENCAGTKRGLERIDRWLGDGHWDVIHFNWGLHDLKFQDAKGRLASPERGTQQTPIEQYEKNLETLVTRLEKTGATLIFATTTPVPKGSAGRIVGDAAKYNSAARRVMRRHRIQINDLYAVAKALPADCKRKANVHYTPKGSKRLGAQVAESIREALKTKQQLKKKQ